MCLSVETRSTDSAAVDDVSMTFPLELVRHSRPDPCKVSLGPGRLVDIAFRNVFFRRIQQQEACYFIRAAEQFLPSLGCAWRGGTEV